MKTSDFLVLSCLGQARASGPTMPVGYLIDSLPPTATLTPNHLSVPLIPASECTGRDDSFGGMAVKTGTAIPAGSALGLFKHKPVSGSASFERVTLP